MFKLIMPVYLGGPAIPPIPEKAARRRRRLNKIKYNFEEPNFTFLHIFGLFKVVNRTAPSVHLPSFVATFFVSGWSVKKMT